MEEKNSYVGVCLPEIYVISWDNTWKVYSIMASLNILLQVNNLKSILKSILSIIILSILSITFKRIHSVKIVQHITQ